MLIHIYVFFRNDIALWANVFGSGKFSQANDRQNWITSEAFVSEEISSNFIFNDELVSKSISSICILLGIFIIVCSLSENALMKASMQSSSLP